jgi:DtxR family transcriptional regulator, Mn-dependent transcriptional regulator
MYTHSEENYLKAIWKLIEDSDDPVNTNEIAAAVNTRAASVSDMLKKLAARKLIHYVPYQGVKLSAEGQRVAIGVVRKHRLWEYFLVEKLGFGWDEVHEVAEQLEHIQSERLTEELDRFLGHPKKDPHGDPIPDKSGKFSVHKDVGLNRMNCGEKTIMMGVCDHSSVFLQYLDKHGLKPGCKIEIREIDSYDQSMQVRVDGKRNLALSSRVTENILVQKPSRKK